MFLLIAALFGIAWIMGFVVFHVTVGAVHLLLVAAIIGLVVHLVRGSQTAAP